jgi:ferredoxin
VHRHGRKASDRVTDAQTPFVAEVDSDICVGCGMCQTICPEGAVTVVEIARIDTGRCTGCGQCVAACPVVAAHLRPRPTRAVGRLESG